MTLIYGFLNRDPVRKIIMRRMFDNPSPEAWRRGCQIQTAWNRFFICISCLTAISGGFMLSEGTMSSMIKFSWFSVLIVVVIHWIQKWNVMRNTRRMLSGIEPD